MNIEKQIQQETPADKILSILCKLKHGEGLTKKELAQKLGFTSPTTIEKWTRKRPEINNHRVYVKTGQSYMAVYVNMKYKHELILSGKVRENY